MMLEYICQNSLLLNIEVSIMIIIVNILLKKTIKI